MGWSAVRGPTHHHHRHPHRTLLVIRRGIGVLVDADDLAAVVDAEGYSPGRAREVDRGEVALDALDQQEAVISAPVGSLVVEPTICPRLLMPKGTVNRTPGASKSVKSPPLSRKPWIVVPSVGMDADDLATIVDVDGGGHGGSGHVDRGEPALVPQEAVDHAVGVEVVTHHLPAVVDADGPGLHGPGHRSW